MTDNDDNKELITAIAEKIEKYRGKSFATIWKASWRIRNFFIKSTLYTAIMASGVAAVSTAGYGFFYHHKSLKEINENATSGKYEAMIEDSDEKIDEYIKREFEGKNYTTPQVFAKVMQDMWNSIEGYKEPTIDARGYYELDITENGYGICRNMAAYTVKVLQKLGYNAKTYAIYVPEMMTDNSKDDSKEDNNEEGSILDRIDSIIKPAFTHLIGNHDVVFVDVEEDNITAVVDSTTQNLGIYYHGRVYIFNMHTLEDDIDFSRANQYTVAHLGEYAVGSELLDMSEAYLNSFREPTTSKQEIMQKYGIRALMDNIDFFTREDAKITIEFIENLQNGQTSESVVDEVSKNSHEDKSVDIYEYDFE